LKRARRTRTSSGKRKRPKRRKKRKSSDRQSAARVFLGLGSNLGERRSYLETALTEIGRLAPLLRVSSFYQSDPVGYPDQPDFWNAAVEIRWSDSPEELLEDLQKIETRVGRSPSFPNGPREIDIDILDFGGQVRSRPDPILPHPGLSSRRFALAPLAEIAPRWKHPVSGLSARELMKKLPAKPGARRIREKL
jgi:2-amino-4-hydroxy-6-hydroxymethyldihydropteridine diphosphokinase